MAKRQRGKLLAPGIEEYIGADHERACSQLDQGLQTPYRNRCSVLACRTWSLQPERVRCRLHGSRKGSAIRTGRVDEHGNDGRCGYQLAQQLQPLRPYLYVQIGYARQVAAGPVQAGDKPNLDRVDRYREDDRNGRSRRLGRQCRRSAAARRNHGHLTLNQFGRKRRQSIILALRPAIFDRDVLALDISCLFQPLQKRR